MNTLYLVLGAIWFWCAAIAVGCFAAMEIGYQLDRRRRRKLEADLEDLEHWRKVTALRRIHDAEGEAF